MLKIFISISIVLFGLVGFPHAEDLLETPVQLSGKVTDGFQPIVGATVMLLQGDSVIAGTSTDEMGKFHLDARTHPDKSLTIHTRSLGYLSTAQDVRRDSGTVVAEIVLVPSALELGGIAVIGSSEKESVAAKSLDKNEVRLGAQRSFLATNPIAAIQQPEIVRQGSNHSSRIRTDGSAPEFFVNGAPVGTDPDHYGMFAVLPTAAVDGMTVETRGTSADNGAPSAVKIETPRAYHRYLSGEIDISVIEATGAAALGDDHHFAFISARKSILDKLVKSIDARAGRRTIPPAGFNDIFVSLGRRFGNDHEVILNQYHVSDRMEYNTGATGASPDGVSTFQDTEEHLVSARYVGLHGNLLTELTGGLHLRDEKYAATSEGSPRSLKVDLRESSAEVTAGAKLAREFGGYSIEAGWEAHANLNRETAVEQRNWNFLPPDATSDSPHIYQIELNLQTAHLQLSQRDADNAFFSTGRWSIKGVTVENGIRVQTYSSLGDKSDFLHRHRLAFSVGELARFSLFAGSFAQNPVSRLLQPFQVLIRADRAQLKSIRTELVAFNGTIRELAFGVFAKRITNIPVLEPDFSKVAFLESERGGGFSPLLLVAPGFLSMKPLGTETYYGGDITVTREHFLDQRLSVKGSYAYSHSTSTSPASTNPSDLHSPHRIYTRFDFAISRVFSMGSEIAYRSGYPYTPYRIVPGNSAEQRYSRAYYVDQASLQNSERFPASFQLNLNFAANYGHSQFYLNVANLTNRGNPVINTHDGYIYDAGILPSIGYRLTF